MPTLVRIRAYFAAIRVFFALALVSGIVGCASRTHLETIEVTSRVIPWTHVPLRNDPDNFQFAVVADRTGGHREGVFRSAMDKVDLLNPEFVMCVGDLTEGGTEDKQEIKQQMDEIEDIIMEKRMPFFRLPGNHDISNDIMTAMWEKYLGRTYYHFVYRDVLFLCLNSEDPPQYDRRPSMSDQQVTYFEKVLALHPDVRWTLVFMHKPMWQMETENWPMFERLLSGRKYTVFAGHHHTYQKAIHSGMVYYKLATTGGSSSLAGLRNGNFDHVMWITMTDDGPRVANLLLEGILDDDPRRAESKRPEDAKQQRN